MDKVSDIDKSLKIRNDLYNKYNGNFFNALDADLKTKPIKPSKVSSSWKKYLSSIPKEPIEFYIHIPYCISRCAYCNLYSKVGTQEDINCYVDKLISYLDYYKKIFKNTVFRNFHIGGGTPGIVSDNDFDRLLNYVFSNFKFESDGGRCCEMSPLTTTESKIAILKKYNFHRIGIGIQSLDKTVLKINNRSLQTEESIRKAISQSKKAGIKCINVDVMVGLAGNTRKNIIETFEKVVEMRPENISFYPVQATSEYLNNHFHGSGQEYDKYCNKLLRESIDEIKLIAEKNGYCVPNLKNSYLIKSFIQCYSFVLYDNNPYKTHKEYIPKEPKVSIFGVGEGASSLIYGILDYKTIKFNKNFLNCKFEGCERNNRFEMIEYIVRTLSNKLSLSLSTFKKKFNVDLIKKFKSNIDLLNQLDVIKIKNDRLYFTEEDRKKRFIYLTLFIDDKMLKNSMRKNFLDKVSLEQISNKKIEERLKEQKAINEYQLLLKKISLISGDSEMIEAVIVKKGPDFVNVTNKEGKTLLLEFAKDCLFTKKYLSQNNTNFEEQCSQNEVLKMSTNLCFFVKKGTSQTVLVREILFIN